MENAKQRLSTYGKMNGHMKTTEAPAIPAPPSLIGALTAGFDAIANRIGLILFPLALDLLLWLGPHVRVKQIVDSFAAQLSLLYPPSSEQAAEALHANQELWAMIGERLNLAALLRTYPVGIPSLMASRLPVEAPSLSSPIFLEISTFSGALAVWALFSIVGIVAATLYFVEVARAAVPIQMRGRKTFGEWGWASVQVLLLTFLWGVMLVGVSIPASCIISALAFSNPSLARFAVLIYAGGLVWLIFPLLFSPHGIFVNRSNAVLSLKSGVRVTRMTLPTTGMFFLAVLVLSQGLDVLWKIPPETSWFTVIGVLGHAFITTGLLASSFIYYREADQWSQKMLSYWSKAGQKA